MSKAVSRERTRNYLRQIQGAVVYRVVAIAASFIAIPMMIRYLGQEQYGVWSTLLTVMSWVVFFDLGVANGLRNKVAESLARGKTAEAGRYIASGYTLIGLIALAICTLVVASSYFVPWQSVFNTHAVAEATLRKVVQIGVFFIVLNFWVGLIGALLGAVQRTSLVALGQGVSSLLILAFVFFISKTTHASISNLVFVYGLSLVIANILLSLWFYRIRPELRPRLHLDSQHLRPLLTVGLQFFTIQLAVLIMFTTDKILITQFFGPQYVTQYDIVFKLFSVITFAHGLISAPLWSAYTDAYHRNDFAWIAHMIKWQLKIFIGSLFAVCLLVLLAEPIIRFWIGPELPVPFELTLVMALFVVVSIWNNVFAILVNGIGQIRLQLYTSLVAMMVNIPLSIFFSQYTGLGLAGIVVGTICSLLIAAIALPVQVHRLIRSTGQG